MKSKQLVDFGTAEFYKKVKGEALIRNKTKDELIIEALRKYLEI